MKVVAAYGEKLRSPFKFQYSPSCERTTHFVYLGNIHYGSPVYLPELTGIEFLGQFFDALFYEGLAFFRDYQGIFIFGLEVVCLLHWYETDSLFVLCFNPTQEIRPSSAWQLGKDLLYNLS